MKTNLKKITVGFKPNRKLALVNLHTDFISGWIHAGCAKRLNQIDLVGEWQAIPVLSLAKKLDSHEPCGICCNIIYSENNSEMDLIASELCR